MLYQKFVDLPSIKYISKRLVQLKNKNVCSLDTLLTLIDIEDGKI